jgi:hypothetical protein
MYGMVFNDKGEQIAVIRNPVSVKQFSDDPRTARIEMVHEGGLLDGKVGGILYPAGKAR